MTASRSSLSPMSEVVACRVPMLDSLQSPNFSAQIWELVSKEQDHLPPAAFFTAVSLSDTVLLLAVSLDRIACMHTYTLQMLWWRRTDIRCEDSRRMLLSSHILVHMRRYRIGSQESIFLALASDNICNLSKILLWGKIYWYVSIMIIYHCKKRRTKYKKDLQVSICSPFCRAVCRI